MFFYFQSFVYMEANHYDIQKGNIQYIDIYGVYIYMYIHTSSLKGSSSTSSMGFCGGVFQTLHGIIHGNSVQVIKETHISRSLVEDE